jgi:hypothetical protein
MSKTAVQWLADQYEQKIGKGITMVMLDEINQALQMEKEQIKDAWCNGFDEDDRATSNPFKYYNETYGGNK